MAKLYFRYAAMGAGKSLDILKVSFNYKERGKKVVLFSSSLDERFGTGVIASRIGISEEAIMVNQTQNIYDVILGRLLANEQVDCILVDESQFLTKNQIKQLTNITDDFDIPVICYGLRVDYRGEPFEGSSYLMALADSIEEIKTICHCGKKATMNMRIVDGKAVYDGEQIHIGGNESYVSVCRKHYNVGNYGK